MVKDLNNYYCFKIYSWFGVIFSILHHGTKSRWKKNIFFCHFIGFSMGTRSILMTLSPGNFVSATKPEKNFFHPCFAPENSRSFGSYLMIFLINDCSGELWVKIKKLTFIRFLRFFLWYLADSIKFIFFFFKLLQNSKKYIEIRSFFKDKLEKKRMKTNIFKFSSRIHQVCVLGKNPNQYFLGRVCILSFIRK